MSQVNADYIVLGQGISGTFLSYYLLKAGKKVIVIDESKPFTASKIASGVINPVTGRRVVQTWLIEEIMPFAVNAYETLGQLLQAPLIQQCNVLSFHGNTQMQKAFEDRNAEDYIYLKQPDNIETLKQYFNFYFGVGETDPCYLADMQTLLQHWRKYLIEKNALIEESFNWNDCTLTPDSVSYKHITAQKIICCDGIAGTENPFFHLLPYAKNKGEALIAEIPGLPRTHIFKQNSTIVPWKDNLFWIGSQYEWNYSDANPSASFRLKTELLLQQWLKLPYKITEHWAAERPANIERRPFVGLHPHQPSVGILNGMGTKGCSLAPFFANQLAEYLINNTPIHPLADVSRFSKVLARN
jgi:glycine/D-amino acid oxidase-like deaminating enzyme